MWRLENTALDGSGNGLHGTVTGATYTAGKIGQCLSFNGTSDFVSLPPGLDNKGHLTITAWMRCTDTVKTNNRTIISNSLLVAPYASDFDLRFNGAAAPGKLRFFWGNTLLLTSSTELDLNQWYHVAAVRSGSSGNWTARIYVGGRLDGTLTSITTNPNGSNNQTRIGKYVSLQLDWWKGLLDEVYIWNRALTQPDIRRVMMGMPPIG